MINDPAPIVVGVDGSAPSRQALDWAARQAAAQHCPLRIVHALLDERGVEASGQERYIAGTFCDRAAARVADQFDRGGYTPYGPPA
jgi:hypothetical protein